MGVDTARWDEFGHTVSAESDLPFGVVDDPVMSGAEQHAVLEIGSFVC